MELVTYATRVCKLLDVQTMIGRNDSIYSFQSNSNCSCGVVTNAAGGLNPDYSVGDIVMLNDVRCLANRSPSRPEA